MAATNNNAIKSNSKNCFILNDLNEKGQLSPPFLALTKQTNSYYEKSISISKSSVFVSKTVINQNMPA